MNAAADVTRQEVLARLGAAMRGSASSDRFGFRQRAGHARTFALEVNHAEGDPLARVDRFAFDLGMQMLPTADASLAVVAGERGGMFVDVADSRFWLVHSTGPAAWLEPLLSHLITRSADLDWCWLPLSILEDLQAEGRTKWFKSDFRGEELLPAAGVAARRLKIQLEGDDAGALRRLIAQQSGYETALSLTGVTIELADGDGIPLTAAAHYRGGFTGLGASFDVYQALVGRTIDAYAARVRAAESDLAIRWSVDMERPHATLSGGTVEILLHRPIPDLYQFATSVLSSREPFRLWAMPTPVSSQLVEAEVADLHVGQVFKLDLLPDRLRIYLEDGVCANTIFRLLANIQHRFDAMAVAESGGARLD